jgi:hypothetical protein
MKTKRFLSLAASLGLALAFTLSCSVGDDHNGGGGNNNGNGQGIPFNENSQIYYEYLDEDDVYRIGDAYNGSGVIKMQTYDDDGNIIIGINAGNVSNGIVNLNLPTNISNGYLEDLSFENLQGYCTDYPKDIKVFERDFTLTNNNGEYIGELNIRYSDEQIAEGIAWWYFSKAVKITCNLEQSQDGRYNSILNWYIDAKVGWNKMYLHYNWDRNYAGRVKTAEISTNNILTKEMKWIISPD